MSFKPNFARQIIWKFKCFALTKHACVKNWFNSKYFFLFELLTLKAVLLSNKLVRQYIILKGKDPDYVAPPPPPPLPPPPPPEPILRTSTGKPVFYNTKGLSTNINCGFRNEWVSKPSTHPVLKLRNTFKPAPVEEPLQVTITDIAAQYPVQEELNAVVEEIKAEAAIMNASPEEKKNEE